jgi:hypothetical protein
MHRRATWRTYPPTCPELPAGAYAQRAVRLSASWLAAVPLFTAFAHAAPPAGSQAPGAIPAPSLASLLATKWAGVIREVVSALHRLCSAYSFSVLSQNLPIEGDHGEHLLSQRHLVTEHRPRARQRSVGIVGHKWSAQSDGVSLLGRFDQPASHSPMCVRQAFAACTAHLPNSGRGGQLSRSWAHLAAYLELAT